MRKVINLCFVVLAVAAVVYGLKGRYSKPKAIEESRVMKLINSEPQNHNLISDSEEEVAVPH
tara:strand:+ start:2233 stop:2418 length:186 start_codon:yes stop_codon:yes gene_type:complete